MINLVKRFIADETGASAVEYALILGAIVVASYAALSAVGTVTSTVFGLAVADLNATGK
jgi:pilus assembly protein Flp/PilA